MLELEKEKQDLEKRFSDKMKVLEREKRDLMVEIDKKALILKEKEKVKWLISFRYKV